MKENKGEQPVTKYSYEKIEDNKSYVWHTEREGKTLIAITDNVEKAHFLATAANNYSLSENPPNGEPEQEIEKFIKSVYEREIPDDFYPGKQYQKLFNWLHDKGFVAIQSEMQEVINIVHEDFPSKVQENEQQLIFADEIERQLMETIDERDQKIEELKDWKESAISVMPDMQAIGKALNVPLGQSVHDKILPGIERLKEREDGELKRLIKAAYNEFNQFGTETTLTAIMDIVDLREALSQSKEGEDIDGEFRMILSHAFLGFDISDISKETFDLAISECVKYANKLLSKENEGKQAVWVEVSEKLPSETGQYFIKMFHENAPEEIEKDVADYSTIGGWMGFAKGWTVIEWLDESIQSGERGEVERLKGENKD